MVDGCVDEITGEGWGRSGEPFGKPWSVSRGTQGKEQRVARKTMRLALLVTAAVVAAVVLAACGGESGGNSGGGGGGEEAQGIDLSKRSQFFDQQEYERQLRLRDVDPEGPSDEPWIQAL